MNKRMNYSKLVKSIINDESIKITSKELEDIIDNELEKTEEEMNTDLIEFCLDELEKLEKKAISAENGKKVDTNGSVKKHIVWKYLIAALISIIMVAGTLTVYAAVFDADLFDGIVEIYNDYIKIRFDKTKTEANNYEFSGSDLARKLAENGISPVLLPGILLSDECKITSVDYEFTELVTSATVHFIYKEKENFIDIDKYVYENSLPAVDYPCASSEIKQFDINGITVYIFMQSGRSTIAYQDGTIQYVIDLKTNFDEAVSFAETIK